MKIAIIAISFLITTFGYSQCSNIIKKYDEMKDEKYISSPYQSAFETLTGFPKKTGTIGINKTVKNGKEYIYISFCGGGNISLIGIYGLFIKLSNGEILRFDNFKIDSSYYGKDFYSYICLLNVDEETVKPFLENEIIEFQISDIKYTPKKKESIKFKEYVNCIVNNKA